LIDISVHIESAQPSGLKPRVLNRLADVVTNMT
jgi:hypothetical protein